MSRPRDHAQRLRTFGALVVLTGCSGTIVDASATGGAGTGGGGAAGRAAGAGAGGSVADVCPPPGTPRPGTAPLRRLTRDEYNSTVRDLLGDASRPADAFTPEGLVHGFPNNVTTQTVAFSLADDTFKAAEKLAASAVGRLDQIDACDTAAKGDEACARAFIAQVGKRAYRRPLGDDEQANLLALYQKGKTSGDHKTGIRFVLTRMLVSPHFLYRPEFGDGHVSNGVQAPSAWEMATRLSYLLWGTMPDTALFDAAAKGQLATDEQIGAQVTRMLADPRAKESVRRFAAGWLLLDVLARSEKDATLAPGFADVLPAMTEEIQHLTDEVLGQEGRSIAELFTADHGYANRALATFLALPGASSLGASVDRVTLAPQGAPGPAWRSGILTTSGVLAAFGKPKESSPILRGKFVAEQMLCWQVPLPPANVPPAPSADATNLTTRQRFEQHAESACASCHRMMDPLGFAFESFDLAGRFRDTEKGQPIDASGVLKGTDVDGPFANAIELSSRLARSGQMRACVSRQWLRFALGRDEDDDLDDRSLAQLRCAVKSEQAAFRDVVTAFTRTDAFRYLPGAKP